MLWSLEDLRGYSLRASDGSLGSVHDLLFDDHSWTARWLVVDTAWLLGRRVLIAPAALGHPDATAREFPIEMTKDRIKDAPDVDTDRPLSRQHEADLYGYYGWAPYWGAGGFALAAGAGAAMVPPVGLAGSPVALRQDHQEGDGGDPNLRSAREVTGYYIKASDDSVGHVEDLLIEEAGWVIRYLVVDTRNWLPGRKVLIAPPWVSAVGWENREVTLQLTRKQIESSPEYTHDMTMDRTYEQRLYRHYGGLEYWT